MTTNKNNTACCVGIDIGTTTISAAVISLADGCQLYSGTVQSGAAIEAAEPWAHLQDAAMICERVRTLLETLVGQFQGIWAIGFSGQMHGIVYTDADGGLRSPLYTWQDERAGLDIGGESAVSRLCRITGGSASAGYGIATHYYNLLTGTVPDRAAKLCTIADYAAMVLTDRKSPLVHTSNAASLGCFENGGFLPTLADAGIREILPDVTADAALVGCWRGIPVSAALGDNQASFFGSVREPERSVLVNFGTGSQISLMVPDGAQAASGDIELRPFIGRTQLMSGSALCGGRAYALLERFFAAYASALGDDGTQYEILNRLASDGLDAPLSVCTTFCGRRSDPSVRGCIDGIGEDNFTPSALAAGVLYGMSEELHGLYACMPHETVDTLVASGNAVRLNPALCEVLTRVFGMPVKLPAHTEEAAHGAAMFAALASGHVKREELCKFIKYRED